MSRWAQTQTDIKKLVDIRERYFSQTEPSGMFWRVCLDNGTCVEGVLRGMSMGNNAGRDGFWAYYANMTLATINGIEIVIDFLDIKDLQNIFSEKLMQEYADKGIITIVG